VRLVAVAVASLAFAAALGAEPPEKPAKDGDAQAARTYVGARACGRCHADHYETFEKNSKKRQSFAAVEKMKKRLTPKELEGCYHCHTTGFGKPGGFVSQEQTPDLAYTGCEVCNGPGSKHARTADKADIQHVPSMATCEGCHVASRIKAFNYRPVLRAGAH